MFSIPLFNLFVKRFFIHSATQTTTWPNSRKDYS